MNCVTISGRLTRDPETRYLPSGTLCVQSGLAITRYFKRADDTQGEKVVYIHFEALGNIAQVMATHLVKGRAILIRGYLEMDAWEDKQTKERKTRHKIIVEEFEFFDAPPWEKGQAPAAPPSPTQQQEMELFGHG